jgi:hypothetical protein
MNWIPVVVLYDGSHLLGMSLSRAMTGGAYGVAMSSFDACEFYVCSNIQDCD